MDGKFKVEGKCTLTNLLTKTVWDSLRKGRDSAICSVSDFDKFEF